MCNKPTTCIWCMSLQVPLSKTPDAFLPLRCMSLQFFYYITLLLFCHVRTFSQMLPTAFRPEGTVTYFKVTACFIRWPDTDHIQGNIRWYVREGGSRWTWLLLHCAVLGLWTSQPLTPVFTSRTWCLCCVICCFHFHSFDRSLCKHAEEVS